jgi:RHS repeat-associated protein
LALVPNHAGAIRNGRHLSRVAATFERLLRRAICVLVVLSMLASSTPAAPQTLVSIALECQVSFGFWLRASGLPKFLHTLTGQTRSPNPQEKQVGRDAQVARIQISPGDVTIKVDAQVTFAAAAYDQNDGPVGGIKIRWSGYDTERKHAINLSPRGDFLSTVPGSFRIKAEGAGQTAEVTVVVLPGLRRNTNERPLTARPVSSRDLPAVAKSNNKSQKPSSSYLAQAQKKAKAENPQSPRRAHSPRLAKASNNEGAGISSSLIPLPVAPDDGWGDGNYWSADDPGNGRGDPPGRPLDNGAGSGNFQVRAPVLNLPGRGIDLALDLAYNSRVWNKAGNNINFDIDRDWPAPGWSIGYPKVVDLGLGGSMIVDPDGTRHSFNGVVTPYSNGAIDFRGHTADGTLIDYGSYRNSSGVLIWAEVNLPDGSQIHYDCMGPGGMYPTQLIDANGNYITITYVNNTGPRIQTITDTMNRVITFAYDQYNLLTAISAPGLLSGTRTLVRLHYHQISLTSSSYSFGGLTPIVRDSSPWVIDAIYYPGTNSGYWFGDTDSYSSYGMLAKVIEQRGMVFSATSLNEQGTVTQGQMTRKEVYNYPLFVGDVSGTAGSNLNDAPTYTTLTQIWTRDGVNNDQAVTSYDVHQNTNPRTVTVTLPNGTKSSQTSYNSPGSFLDGLVYQDQTLDANNAVLRSSNVTWVQGAYDSPRPTRSEATNQEINKKTAVAYEYGSVYNQVTGIYSYDFADPGTSNATLTNAVRTEFQNSSSYTTSRHIFNLPLVVEAFAADNTTRVSRTDYQYDGQTLANTPGVVMHSPLFDPYTTEEVYGTACCEWEIDEQGKFCVEHCLLSAYNPITDYRGNITQVTTYADAVSLTGTVTETRRYDITGNQVTSGTACCQQTSVGYTIDTQYAYPQTQTRGSASDPYAQVITGAAYDFNTGLGLSGMDSNGRTSQTSYSPDTLRPQTAILPNGGHTDYAYDDTGMTVTSTTYLAPSPADTGAMAGQNIRVVDGRGQVRQEKALAAPGVWDIVDTIYDNMGRVAQQSQPYRTGTPRWSYVSYDSLGRSRKVIAPDYTLSDGSDGSTTETFYNETTRPSIASASPGETTRVRDAWGRERWVRADVQGRLVEVVEPNPSGNGSVFETGALRTTYAYNTLGNLIQVNQDAQTRLFKYDSLGRMVAQKLAETGAAINDSGSYVGVGGSGAVWSDYFRYENVRSNMVQRLDARGVKTNYWYFNPAGHSDPGDGTAPDPLNRLQSISWDTSIANQNLQPTDPNYVLSAALVTYQYRNGATNTTCDPSGSSGLKDVTQLASVNAANTSIESYCFDSESRVSSKNLSLTSRSSYPLATNYSYDTLDRVTDVRYPAEYGNGTQPRKVMHYAYDVASELTALTVDGATHASQIGYNAASQPTSLNVGASGPNQIVENYNYDPQTGLLANQTVARSSSLGTHLLDLTYDYKAANGKLTGQLTKITNNLLPSHNKDRSYSYDALGRLVQAKGGSVSAPLWTQTYGYDKYGNRTSVSASGYTAKLNSGSTSGSEQLATAKRGSSSTVTGRRSDFVESPTVNTQNLTSVPSGPVDPGVSQLPDVSAPNAEALPKEVEGPIAGTAKSANSNRQMIARNSHHASRLTPTAPLLPQGGPPTFTDPDLLASGGVAIKALHITELRSAIDALRVRLGSSVFSWQTAAASGGPIKADPILEMRTALDQVLGAPAAPGYSTGLAQYQPVLAIHIQELRNRVVANWNTQIPVPVDGHANLSYDPATNRITTAGFAYDAAGNQTRALISSGASQRFQYDAANRLIKVKADDNITLLASYTYGDSNERLIAEEDGLRTYYGCEGDSTVVEYTESGVSTIPTWSKSYIYLGGRLLSTLTANGAGGEVVQYHHPDRLGTRLVTNAQDTTYFEQVTLPFGSALSAESTGTTNRRFTSYNRSAATGLDYAVNRHYDAKQGRFTQVDPIGMDAASLTSPQTLNLYTYCANDPINHMDPSGLSFFSKLFKWLGKALKILTIVSIVVMTLIIFAPASSFVFKAALWMFIHILLPLSQLPVLGAFVPLGMMGSPPWNPNSHSGFGLSWQGQEPQVAPEDVIRTTVWAPGTWWDEFLAAVPSSGIGTPWLFGEWATGGGPRSRRFDSKSRITANMRTSPDVAAHRQAFCASGKPYYNSSDHGALKFGRGGNDSPWRAGPLNEGRQFVGSFELRIKKTIRGNTLFVIKNKTSLPSALYHIPGVPDVKRPGPLQTITQYFWWTEDEPCK